LVVGLKKEQLGATTTLETASSTAPVMKTMRSLSSRE
jgi:hypothetical protein